MGCGLQSLTFAAGYHELNLNGNRETSLRSCQSCGVLFSLAITELGGQNQKLSMANFVTKIRRVLNIV